MSHREPHILVVDDDESLRLLIKIRLSYLPNSAIHTASDGISALALLAKQPIDLLITDFSMPGMNGVTLIEQAQATLPDLPAVMISASHEAEIKGHAKTARIERIFKKPIPFQRFCEQVETILRANGTHLNGTH